MESYKLQVNDCQLKIYSVKPEISETAILFLHGGPGSGAKAIGIICFSNIKSRISLYLF